MEANREASCSTYQRDLSFNIQALEWKIAIALKKSTGNSTRLLVVHAVDALGASMHSTTQSMVHA